MRDFQIPIPPNPLGQAKLILKGAGLGLLKPVFYKINENEKIREQVDVDKDPITTKFGQPVFDSFYFNCDVENQVTYVNSKEMGGGNVEINEPFFFPTALITINQTKNIVKTPIAGLNGTVKEYMSEGDFMINVKGVIVGATANQPIDQKDINNLLKYLKAPTSLPIFSNFLDELKITQVVVDSYSIGQREGMRNVIDIDMNLLSDLPVELSTNNGKTQTFV